MSDLATLFEGKIDFHGQALVDTISRVALGVITTAAFLSGFVTQNLSVTFGVLGVGVVLLFAVVLPPWGIFNKHHVKWTGKGTKAQ